WESFSLSLMDKSFLSQSPILAFFSTIEEYQLKLWIAFNEGTAPTSKGIPLSINIEQTCLSAPPELGVKHNTGLTVSLEHSTKLSTTFFVVLLVFNAVALISICETATISTF